LVLDRIKLLLIILAALLLSVVFSEVSELVYVTDQTDIAFHDPNVVLFMDLVILLEILLELFDRFL
jgi:hypothetical protein